ncbi:enoyl-CoA hydratase/isomerase family protein [Microbacterium sp. C7(2022)]|uniref:enoyl-CoA hydratase/isomerase family protein n=1 Tax=Microbacterium sp. C7(2022) TaxID=2992759 RepID=UPI00237C0115|nr:enoyl-CoA hydratase-related protein [Microbacterium sp. C7(2022)]MDE0546567.1 enoyl-CoA hydratase-related protein [Microbacterium sp. C7(2022)]
MSDSIIVNVSDGIARVTFNRPAFLNAMNFEMGRRWRDVAHEVTSDPSVGAVILDAAGPAFCAGGDVFEMGTSGATGADVTAAANTIHEGIRTFVESDKPIVAAVQGAVAGGGLGLMLTADYIVAADSSKFVSKYANIGLTPDLGVSTLLTEAVGERRALQLVLQDRTLSAAEALEWGMIAEALPAAEVAARVEEVAAFWLSGATAAFGQAKRLVRTARVRSFADNLDDEAKTIGAAFDTEASKVRVAGFVAATAKRAAADSTAASSAAASSTASEENR